ncbi:hypothetical protein AVEN_267076-1 [Araneus ventricosus]|uniref:Ig-like domain-containing protein n=1 Tax=Araneus ventricosus TaxID=182803 RepID=A0A4Y2IQ60_ARAVE|nr:hypothetical protein AVEN_267076-1 [Araneus ventricosus]
MTKRIEYVFGDNIEENLTCDDEIFICERNTRKISLKPTISPDFSESVPSIYIIETFLTCEVPFKSQNFSEIEHQLHYVWYKDEIPISVDNRILELSSYPEPVKQLSSSVIRQGTYSCVVTVEGIVDHFSSQYVNYFHSETETYIAYMQAGLNSVLRVDFSQGEAFYAFMGMVNNSMAEVINGTPWDTWKDEEKPRWDYQMSWKNEENVTVQLLLYAEKDLPSVAPIDYNLEKEFKNKVLTILNSSFSLELHHADTCSDQAVPSSSTSYNITFLWKKTRQTKLATSEPMCLNGKLLFPASDFIS